MLKYGNNSVINVSHFEYLHLMLFDIILIHICSGVFFDYMHDISVRFGSICCGVAIVSQKFQKYCSTNYSDDDDDDNNDDYK